MPPRRKKAQPPPVAPTSIIQIPRKVFTSCVAFACTGIAPELDKLEKTEALIIRVWKALAIGNIAITVLLASQEESIPSLIRFMEFNSSKDRTEFLRLTQKYLSLCDEYSIGKNIKCLAFSQLFEAVNPIHDGCCPEHRYCKGICICSLSKFTDRLEIIAQNLEMENLEGFGRFRLLIAGMHQEGTHGTEDSLEECTRNPIVKLLAKDIYNLVSAFYDSHATSSSSPSATSLSSNPAIQFFELMAYLGGAKIIAFANFYMLGYESDNPVTNAWPFENIYGFTDSFERSKKSITLESMEEYKVAVADKLVLKGRIAEAIGVYGVVGEISPNVGARVNAACLRLRVAEDTDIYQFQLVIMDCTFALELEPNHVKALFRRGLALCKLRMWTEGIVDFERALELDPRIPAAQELVIARREVTKKIAA